MMNTGKKMLTVAILALSLVITIITMLYVINFQKSSARLREASTQSAQIGQQAPATINNFTVVKAESIAPFCDGRFADFSFDYGSICKVGHSTTLISKTLEADNKETQRQIQQFLAHVNAVGYYAFHGQDIPPGFGGSYSINEYTKSIDGHGTWGLVAEMDGTTPQFMVPHSRVQKADRRDIDDGERYPDIQIFIFAYDPTKYKPYEGTVSPNSDVGLHLKSFAELDTTKKQTITITALQEYDFCRSVVLACDTFIPTRL